MSLNVLVVDDSETSRAVIIKSLKLSGIDVNEMHQAGNGRDAIALMHEHWIDLVFADINMPVMNGVEMINAMSSEDVLREIPVIVVSTEGSATRIEQLKEKGISAFVRKPFTPERIRSVVHEVLETSHGK